MSNFKTAAIGLVFLQLCGCTTFHAVPVDALSSSPEALEVGDAVLVEKKDGSTVAFTVSSIDANTIAGQGNRIALSEIAKLQVRRTDPGKTTFAVIGVGAIVASFAFLADVNDLVDDLESAAD